MTIAKPFLKWAGGKRSLLPTLIDKLPKEMVKNETKVYVEPFLGGGAVALHFIQNQRFDKIILNDINISLINTYIVVKEDVESLIQRLVDYERKYLMKDENGRKEEFYAKREKFNELKFQVPYLQGEEIDDQAVDLAAHFILLNKTCFNGLYRENMSGRFNTPHGRYKNPIIADVENLKNCSNVFQDVTFTSVDFEELSGYIGPETFIYMDPPYRPLDASQKQFNGYSKGSFDDEEQIRLAQWCRFLDRKQALFMLSNSNPKVNNPDDDFFNRIFKGFLINEDITAARTISAKGSTRKPVKEILVTNYL